MKQGHPTQFVQPYTKSGLKIIDKIQIKKKDWKFRVIKSNVRDNVDNPGFTAKDSRITVMSYKS